MPYDIQIFRGDPDAPDPIAPAETVAALRGLRDPTPALDAPEWRVWADKTPWYVAHIDGGILTLSASYTNPEFMNLLPRFGHEAVRIAGVLRGRALEEVGGEQITAENVAATYAPGAPTHAHLRGTIDGVWRMINQEARAPLDFPVGPYDMVGEYFMFHVRGAASATLPAVRAALDAAFGPHRILADGPALSVHLPFDPPGFWKRLLGGPPPVPPAVKVLVRPDGVVQIWPWWEVGFATCGPLVVEAATRIHAAVGGDLTFHGVPYDDAIARALGARLGGTNTDLWLWTQKLHTGSAT